MNRQREADAYRQSPEQISSIRSSSACFPAGTQSHPEVAGVRISGTTRSDQLSSMSSKQQHTQKSLHATSEVNALLGRIWSIPLIIKHKTLYASPLALACHNLDFSITSRDRGS